MLYGTEPENEQEHDYDRIEVANKTRGSKNVTPKYSPNIHREYDTTKPILSWRSTATTPNYTGHSRQASFMGNVNNNNYMEYIEYQRDIISNLRQEINDIYKPLLLQKKNGNQSGIIFKID